MLLPSLHDSISTGGRWSTVAETGKAGGGRQGPGRARAVRAGATIGYVTSSTLADEVFERVKNPVTAWQILNYVAIWGVFVEVHGREPRSYRDMETVATQSYVTLSRWGGKFRTAFPEYDTPALLWAKVRPQLDPAPIDTPESVAFRIGGAALS
jgi:hypothetical protein